MTVVDVGCGLGYLGYTYWPFFRNDGYYIGVDLRHKLASEASQASEEWARGGRVDFVSGDAYELPLPDSCSDLVMCQIVLMHLEKPMAALSEMLRVARPGALVTCIEPDHLSGLLSKPHWSLSLPCLEEELLLRKVHLIANKGRIKLGRGDRSIGPKIAPMMKNVGFGEIDVRVADKVGMLLPPYEGARDENVIMQLKKRFLDKNTFDMEMKMKQEEFIAGGGDPVEFDRCRAMEIRNIEIIRRQIGYGEYSFCGATFLYITKGRKPRGQR
jgi:ubiquinone/menaquinone biosynthesis C-methylase UbiE